MWERWTLSVIAVSSSLDRRGDRNAERQQLAMNLMLVKQMFFVGEMTVIPPFLGRSNRVL